MKESLLELLIDLFEKTITQLKETSKKEEVESFDRGTAQLALLKSSTPDAFRMFMLEEQLRLADEGYQLLYRLMIWKVVSLDMIELVINRLMLSESRVIELAEVKWTIHQTMANLMDPEQLAFLDLVLYDTSEGLITH